MPRPQSTRSGAHLEGDGTFEGGRDGFVLARGDRAAGVRGRAALADGLCAALAGTRERRSAHDPGRVLCDLAVMAADGGRCVSDLARLARQHALLGEVASVSTAPLVLLSIGESEPESISWRGHYWQAGAAPERVKGGFGFNPPLLSCAREVLAGILRPANAAAGNGADRLRALELALEQLPQSFLDGQILARVDSAGASRDFADACRETRIRFSLGYKARHCRCVRAVRTPGAGARARRSAGARERHVASSDRVHALRDL